MGVRGVRIALLAAVVAVGVSASAARAALFVAMDGPHAGTVIDPRHLTGTLLPTSPNCPTYAFHGRLDGRRTVACALPAGQLPRVFSLLGAAVLVQRAIVSSSDFRRLPMAGRALRTWHRALGRLAADGRVSASLFDDETARYETARYDNERAARAANGHHRSAARKLITEALGLEHAAFAALPIELVGGLVPTAPTTGSPTDLGSGSAAAIYGGTIAISNGLGRTEEACAFRTGHYVHCDATSPSEALAVGPGGLVGGVQSGHAFVSDPLFLSPIVGPPGEIFSGDRGVFVGEQTRHGRQRAGTFEVLRGRSAPGHARAPRLRFTPVGHLSDSSTLLAVSGTLAFGLATRHGSVGGLVPIRVNLRTGRARTLFAPLGGSAAPTASNSTGLAGGTSGFLSGRDVGTFWWGARHYLPFGAAHGDTLIVGLNDAGVAVGAMGNPAHFHAALFEFGRAYDLNQLIPPGSGWTLTQANAIDGHGRIVGTGFRNGYQRAYELTLR